jgi:hypothetical protein
MRDVLGNEMAKYIVSGRVSGPDLILTLVLKSKMETRKIDVNKSAFPADPESLAATVSEKEFGEKTEAVREAVRLLAKGDEKAGKFFLREAMDAYDVRSKLQPSQIEEAIMGVFLVGGVSDL